MSEKEKGRLEGRPLLITKMNQLLPTAAVVLAHTRATFAVGRTRRVLRQTRDRIAGVRRLVARFIGATRITARDATADGITAFAAVAEQAVVRA